MFNDPDTYNAQPDEYIPKAGEKCQGCYIRDDQWDTITIRYFGKDLVIFELKTGEEKCVDRVDHMFRPMPVEGPTYIPMDAITGTQLMVLLNAYDIGDDYINLSEWDTTGDHKSLLFENGFNPRLMLTYECKQNGYTQTTYEEAMS